MVLVSCRSFPSGTAVSRRTPAYRTSSSTVTPTSWMFSEWRSSWAHTCFTITCWLTQPFVSVSHPKAVLQLEGPGRLDTVQPPGGVRGPGVCGGDRAEEDGGVCPTGESGRERVRSRHPHLHLLQPAVLQPHRQGDLSKSGLIWDFHHLPGSEQNLMRLRVQTQSPPATRLSYSLKQNIFHLIKNANGECFLIFPSLFDSKCFLFTWHLTLWLSRLLPPSPQDQSDIQIECYAEDRLANQRSCNISAPFMKSLSQVGASDRIAWWRSSLTHHWRCLSTKIIKTSV